MIQDKRHILQDLTHKTIGEIYTKFSFILPKVYENIFNKHLLENNKDLNFEVDEELRIILETMDDTSKRNEDALSKIVRLSTQAVEAIHTENTKALKEIKNEAIVLQLAIAELSSAVYNDEITGFFNRNGFRKNICLLNDLKFDGALFSIDIDYFSRIINSYGVEVGNSVLKSFSVLLKNSFQNVPNTKKFFCRAGVDEFLIAVTEDNVGYVLSEIKKIQAKKYALNIRGNSEDLTFSFGYVAFTKNSEFEKIIMSSDAEMIKNKKERKVKMKVMAPRIEKSMEEEDFKPI